MSTAVAGPVDGFPRQSLLFLLQRARTLITGTQRQRELLTDLHIPAHVVLGRTGPEVSASADRSAAAAARNAVAAPAVRDEAADAPLSPGNAPGPDYVHSQRPAPTVDAGRGRAAGPGTVLDDPGRPAAHPMHPRRFAEALLDLVSTAEHLDAAIVLCRRALSVLPETPLWAAQLSTELEALQASHAADETGASQNLGTLTDWAGFECLHHYSLTDRFFGREAHLERLDRWIADAHGESVVCLTALGGAGKSALAWRWVNAALTRLRGDGFRGALWCSFYEGTFTFEDFLRRALVFCGRTTRAAVDDLSRAEVEDRLVAALTRDRYLLVVDGLERIMTGYAQTAERAIDDEGARGTSDRGSATWEDRRMTDRRDGAFLGRLAAPLASRLLVTTRLAPADLEVSRDGALRPHVGAIELPGLDRRDAVMLWESILPDSPVDDEIDDVLELCAFHPLAISILARSVAAGGSDWAGWRRAENHRDFAPRGSPAQARAHVIGICLRDLGPESQDVLDLLAVSGKPMALGEVTDALRQSSIVNGEERWTVDGRVPAELATLVELGFVGEATVDGVAEYDLHPVVRGAVWRSITDATRSSGHRAFLDQTLSELTPLPALSTTVVDLRATSMFQLLASTGQFDRAWDMFRSRMWWPLYAQGAYRELLDLFEQLLPHRDPLHLLPLLRRREQADATDMLAGLMMAAGDPAVADRLMLWCGIIRLRIHDQVGFLAVRRSQTWQYLYDGRLFAAEYTLRQVKVEAGLSGLGRMFVTVNAWIGLVLALRGDAEQARAYLVVREEDETERRWWLQGTAEGHLYLGEHRKALELLDQLDPNEEVEPTQEAWEQLTRGMAETGIGELDRAVDDLEAALGTARRTGYRIVQCFAIVALAEIAAARERWAEVDGWIDEYFLQVDPDGRQRLTAGDAWRLRALSAQARGDVAGALEYAATAYLVSACDGPPFTHAAGVERARDLLRRLGGYVPRTSSPLDPDWQHRLKIVRAQEAKVDELAAGGRRLHLIRLGSPEQRQRARNVVYAATEDDARWWGLVAGTEAALTEPLLDTMVELDISIAELRRLFESSAEKSLEVVIYRLLADRFLLPDVPRPVGECDDAERTAWLDATERHRRDLDEFLGSDLARDTEKAFRHEGLDARGVEAFSLDCRRRIGVDDAGPVARRWWSRLEEVGTAWDMLVLGECIQSESATLDELVDAISVRGRNVIEYGFRALAVQRAITRMRVTEVSRTDGWEPFQVRLRLQTLKVQLGWLELAGPAREFWAGIEERNEQQPELVLQLAEELALRGSSISAYHDASVRCSSPEDPRATLAYLDYLRLAAAPWTGESWPDDVSVKRWSYDTASRTFRDVRAWAPEQITPHLQLLQDRLGFASAPTRARDWWGSLVHGGTTAATLVRLAEELEARQADIAECHRAHVDAASDNLLAVLAYLDYSRVASRALSEDEGDLAERFRVSGNAQFENNDFESAVESYRAAIAADPRLPDAYLYLALSLEALHTGDPLAVLREGVASCPDSPTLLREVLRFELGLPRLPAPDLRSMSVELTAPLVEDVDGLLKQVENARDDLRDAIGMTFSGVWFTTNDALAPGTYRILCDGVPVAVGTTVPGARYTLGPDEQEHPVWPAAVDGVPGGWGADGTLTPHAYLVRHLRTVLTALAPQLLTEQMALTMVEDAGWVTTPLDIDRDMALLAAFTEILRMMLDDQVPILGPDELLDEYRPLYDAGLPATAALARLRLLPAVRSRLPGRRDHDARLHLDAEVERRVADAIAIDEPSGSLLVSSAALHECIGEVRSLVGSVVRAGTGPPVLVVADASIRRAVRMFLRAEFPALPVVALVELPVRDPG